MPIRTCGAKSSSRAPFLSLPYPLVPSSPQPFLTQTLVVLHQRRRYFIEAEEVVWDFAPLGGNMCSGDKQPWTPEEAVFTEATHLSLGSK